VIGKLSKIQNKERKNKTRRKGRYTIQEGEYQVESEEEAEE
jgi:hypothetical protein